MVRSRFRVLFMGALVALSACSGPAGTPATPSLQASASSVGGHMRPQMPGTVQVTTAFSPTSALPNTPVMMALVLQNVSGTPLSNISVKDVLPATSVGKLRIVSTTFLNQCGGTMATPVIGATSFADTGISLGATAPTSLCKIIVWVSASTIGTYTDSNVEGWIGNYPTVSGGDPFFPVTAGTLVVTGPGTSHLYVPVGASAQHIAIYAPGSSSPVYTITSPLFTSIEAVAVSWLNGNIFVANGEGSDTKIYVFPYSTIAGKSPGVIASPTPSSSFDLLYRLSDMTVDGDGRLVVVSDENIASFYNAHGIPKGQIVGPTGAGWTTVTSDLQGEGIVLMPWAPNPVGHILLGDNTHFAIDDYTFENNTQTLACQWSVVKPAYNPYAQQDDHFAIAYDVKAGYVYLATSHLSGYTGLPSSPTTESYYGTIKAMNPCSSTIQTTLQDKPDGYWDQTTYLNDIASNPMTGEIAIPTYATYQLPQTLNVPHVNVWSYSNATGQNAPNYRYGTGGLLTGYLTGKISYGW